jgi:hypothetical protein
MSEKGKGLGAIPGKVWYVRREGTYSANHHGELLSGIRGAGYMYEGFVDPIQKITGDAYRAISGLAPGGDGLHLDSAKHREIERKIIKEIRTKSASQIAREVHVSKGTILGHLRKLGYRCVSGGSCHSVWVREEAV